MIDGIYGVTNSAPARALAEALWLSAVYGKVYTGYNSCAADYRQHYWVLHNTAWWCYGGARSVVRRAAKILELTAPNSVKPAGELTLVGHTLAVVSDSEGPSPAEAAIWDVAGASFDAWKEHIAARYDSCT